MDAGFLAVDIACGAAGRAAVYVAWLGCPEAVCRRDLPAGRGGLPEGGRTPRVPGIPCGRLFLVLGGSLGSVDRATALRAGGRGLRPLQAARSRAVLVLVAGLGG